MTTVFPAPVGSSELATARILVVDDDAGVRRFVVNTLLISGYTVHAAGSAEEALRLVAEGNFDVALLDLHLPGRSGIDLLGDLPADGSLVPILLTGTRDVRAAVTAMQRGAFDYLGKPVQPDEIRWMVARALELARTRRRERALARVAAEWEATFDACPDLLLVVDGPGRILRANRAAEALTGMPPTALVGRQVQDVLTGALGVAALRCSSDPGTCGMPLRVHTTETGGAFLVSAHPIAAADSPAPVVVVVKDVTMMHRAEQAQQTLAHRLLTAQEDERGRIARELHDGIGQYLASLALGLSTVVEGLPDDKLAGRLRALWRIAADMLVEIRRMAHVLRPPVLDDLGLVTALGRLTEVCTRLHGVRIEFILGTPPDARLPQAVELAVYRIVQEALTNALKHAAAQAIDVVLDVSAGEVHVSVADDGVGFDDGVSAHPAGASSEGLGLSDMRERAAMLGGRFRVESAPGRGTTIDLRIPLPEVIP